MAGSVSKPSAASARGRVLVVDQDHDCRLSLSSMAAKSGYQVEAVADGEMAKTLIRSRPPDVVLLDAQLPRADGYDVCQWIKEHTHMRIPVIIMSTLANADARQQALDAGADEFMAKPFCKESLLQTLHQLVDIRTAAEQLDVDPQSVADALDKLPRR